MTSLTLLSYRRLSYRKECKEETPAKQVRQIYWAWTGAFSCLFKRKLDLTEKKWANCSDYGASHLGRAIVYFHVEALKQHVSKTFGQFLRSCGFKQPCSVKMKRVSFVEVWLVKMSNGILEWYTCHSSLRREGGVQG